MAIESFDASIVRQEQANRCIMPASSHPGIPRTAVSPLYESNRKQLSRVVALAQYDHDRKRSSHVGSELRSKRLADTTAALSEYDNFHPAEALAALEVDGAGWNQSYYETRRAQLLAKIGTRRRQS